MLNGGMWCLDVKRTRTLGCKKIENDWGAMSVNRACEACGSYRKIRQLRTQLYSNLTQALQLFWELLTPAHGINTCVMDRITLQINLKNIQ